MTKKDLRLPEEKDDKNNGIDKKDDNDSLEQILKNFMIQSTKNDEAFKNQIVKINNQVSDLSEDQNSLREDFRSFKEEYVENQRLEPWQKNVIKKHIQKTVKGALAPHNYQSPSIRSLAYIQAYGQLRQFGYYTMNDTKQRFYKDIINAINSGQATITEQEVLERYDYNQWKKQKDLGAQIWK